MINAKNRTGHYNETFFELFKGNSSSKEVVLFLHGYPSDLGDKNSDLAIAVSASSVIDCFVIHYPGLGKSHGSFTFSKSLRIVNEFCAYLKTLGYSDINFVGHSWGGFLALNITEFWTEKSRVVLMSPFLNIPEGAELQALVDAIYYDTKPFLVPQTKAEVLEDLLKLRETSALDKILEKIKPLKNKITFIQATDDEECPPQIAKQFVGEIASEKLEYREMETDHSFAANRALLIELINKGVS